ncbi:hypothetical protein DCAR_0105085 [Daucus carota subsp. sativus]|uniref:Uncharacterized protein n=1 Tax=Daucus carota subsp. sativus TaxID=79200 RepID=A0A166JCI9_DAUCS|nr:PREDICTED: vinorine synthase-like [Daucus carota subsp. sativus]XP_017228915.1 PREDICTED: vinorine synthase-like [Daucus carota subsp. sativus]XP_017228916.1 PREDICTED: vinorine synthase-like [Daucus carota subsp. sativus]WOG85892.1 hypothetical protein DCAR_0105085 [Daucus carota subsp. sativus]
MTFKGLMRLSLVFRRQLHVISRSSCSIKPASPTPSNLKRYNIPLHDRMVPNFYIPLIFFYPKNNSDPIRERVPDNASDLLKKSLSETLSKYYPFAGRICSGSYVDCNDEGVQFIEAQIGCNMSEVQDRAAVKEEDGLGHLFPPCTIRNQFSEKHSGNIMYVQLNRFDCGGMAVAVSISHLLGDALTTCTLLRYWATLSLHSGDHRKLLHLCPVLVNALLPLSYDINAIETIIFPDKNWTTKELVFPNTKLAELKIVVNNEDKLDGVVEDQKYTRNELLTALLYRCLVSVADRTNAGVHNGSVLMRAVNVRHMIDPPLQETTVGNFQILNHIVATTEADKKYRTLVARMRKEREQLKGIKSMEGHEMETEFLEFTKHKYRFYVITSMCNFPLYDIMDFGWGKPVKAVLVDTPMVDVITLMDTANDGIRAVVGLEEQEMKEFLAHGELLTYATL